MQQNTTDFLPVPVIRKINQNRNGFVAEIQNQYTATAFNFTSGFGYINQNGKNNESFGIELQPESKLDITRTNLYNYSNLNLSNNLIATLGLSYDYYDEGTTKNSKHSNVRHSLISPKLGVTWKPFTTTTLRAALFKGMNITRTANQTLEPTQVAGFNQFFDDVNGTVAWRYGAGIDHNISKNVSVGMEYSERKLDVPQGKSPFLDWTEQVGKAYLYVTPNNSISISAEYVYEKFNRQKYNLFKGVDSFNVTNHSIPLTLNFFHSSGLSFMVKGLPITHNFENVYNA